MQDTDQSDPGPAPARLRSALAGLGPRLARVDGVAAAGYLLPFALVLYLGLNQGGFETVVFGEVGIALWWGLLLALLVGALPRAGLGRAGWASLALLAGFAAWTALGTSWAESAGRSAEEAARVATYLGAFALALALQGRQGARRALAGTAAAIVLIGLLALGSRLLPTAFPESDLLEQLPEVRSRLAWPIDYWNGLAALLAIGLPLLLWGASSARSAAVRISCAAVAPAIVLTLYLTISRGGAIAAGAAVLAFFALYPRRLALLPSLSTTAIGALLLIWAASRRSALTDALGDSVARSQGVEMLVLTVIVAAAVAGAHYAIGRAVGSGRIGFPPVGRRRAAIATAAASVALLGAGVTAAASGELGKRFDEFRDPGGVGGTATRFESASGNGRWQYWRAALDAGRSRPLVGIGPGAYEFWWEREGTLAGFTTEAHSLFLESFGELGLIGFLLISGLVGLVLVAGIRRALAAPAARRAMLAAAAAGAVAFALTAATDWVWEVPVIPIAFLIVAAALLGPDAAGHEPRPRRRAPLLAALVVATLAAVLAIGAPLLSQRALDDSAGLVRAGDLDRGLERADRARSWLPFDAEPRLQRALILERQERLEEAAVAAQEAIDRESTNWQNWYVLARIEAQRGDRSAAREALAEAQRLSPRHPLLQ